MWGDVIEFPVNGTNAETYSSFRTLAAQEEIEENLTESESIFNLVDDEHLYDEDNFNDDIVSNYLENDV